MRNWVKTTSLASVLAAILSPCCYQQSQPRERCSVEGVIPQNVNLDKTSSLTVKGSGFEPSIFREVQCGSASVIGADDAFDVELRAEGTGEIIEVERVVRKSSTELEVTLPRSIPVEGRYYLSVIDPLGRASEEVRISLFVPPDVDTDTETLDIEGDHDDIIVDAVGVGTATDEAETVVPTKAPETCEEALAAASFDFTHSERAFTPGEGGVFQRKMLPMDLDVSEGIERSVWATVVPNVKVGETTKVVCANDTLTSPPIDLSLCEGTGRKIEIAISIWFDFGPRFDGKYFSGLSLSYTDGETTKCADIFDLDEQGTFAKDGRCDPDFTSIIAGLPVFAHGVSAEWKTLRVPLDLASYPDDFQVQFLYSNNIDLTEPGAYIDKLEIRAVE